MFDWLNRKWLRKMRTLIGAIRAGEYNVHFTTDGMRGEARLLADELNEVVADTRNEMARLEALYGSYEAILSQVNIALLAVNAFGQVVWMNQKAINDICGFVIPDLASLRSVVPSLHAVLTELIPGQQRLVSLNIKGQTSQLKIAVSNYIQGGESLRLFTIENVQQVIQQSEMEAQRKLVSVLTHEIMNSLSPIISLSDTLSQSMKERSIDDDSLLAVDTINRRSRGLLTFVENYRKLSRISPPQTSWTKVGELIQDIGNLLSNTAITYEVEDPALQLNVDRHQIEHVLINLLKNAIEACDSYAGERRLSACADDKEALISPACAEYKDDRISPAYAEYKDDRISPACDIKLECKADHINRNYLISVTDNGSGIAPEAIDNIFTPFFTTKSNGSGIGLSLSQQIILNHGGLILVASAPGRTVFTIQLPLLYKI